MKNFRSTLIFAVVALGLASYLWFFDRHQKGTAAEEQAETNLFADVDIDKVDSIEIKDLDSALTLRKHEGAWRITAPVATDADPAAVRDLLTVLQSVRALRTIPLRQIPQSSQALQGWQLVPGNIRISFSGTDFSDVLLIGRKTAVSDLVYARASASGDAPVILIAAGTKEAVDKKLADLRSHVALKFTPAQVSGCGVRLAATPGSPTAPVETALQRESTPAVTWKLEKPLAASASTKRVSAWLAQLGALQIKQFISDDAADLSSYGLSAPTSQLWVETPASKTANPPTLLIGVPVPTAPGQVYAKRLSENTVFTLQAADVDKLIHDLPETRERKVLAFDPADATAVKIEQGSDGKGHFQTLLAEKKENGWTFTTPATPGGIDEKKLGDFLQYLSTLEAVKIVSDTTSDLRPYGLDHPSGRLSVTLKKGDTHTLLFGKLDSAKPIKAGDKSSQFEPSILYAKNTDAPVLYALDSSILSNVPKEVWPWRDGQVIFVPLEQIQSVTQIPDIGAPFPVTRTANGFVLDRQGLSLDQEKTGALWNKLTTLRAVRWLGAPQANFGLANPHWKIRITAAHQSPVTLLLGDKESDGWAAMIEGEPFAFVINGADYATLITPPLAGSHATPKPSSAPVPVPTSTH